MDGNSIRDKVIAYNKMYPRRVPVLDDNDKGERHEGVLDRNGIITVRPIVPDINTKGWMDVIVFGKDYKTFTGGRSSN